MFGIYAGIMISRFLQTSPSLKSASSIASRFSKPTSLNPSHPFRYALKLFS